MRKIENYGYRAYAVGGCVRDTLLGRAPWDWDIACSAPPDKIMEMFPRSRPSGIVYGTVTVSIGNDEFEITTFRKEGEYTNGRKPDSVSFVAAVEEDLCRRDFTVNAMAADINGTITDPFGGIDDIERKLIRCVGNPEKRFSAFHLFFSPFTIINILKRGENSSLLSYFKVIHQLVLFLLYQARLSLHFPLLYLLCHRIFHHRLYLRIYL